MIRSNGGKAKKGRSAADLEDELDASEVGAKPAAKSATDALMDKFPPFDPTWPPNIQEQWFTAFAKMQEMVKGK